MYETHGMRYTKDGWVDAKTPYPQPTTFLPVPHVKITEGCYNNEQNVRKAVNALVEWWPWESEIVKSEWLEDVVLDLEHRKSEHWRHKLLKLHLQQTND